MIARWLLGLAFVGLLAGCPAGEGLIYLTVDAKAGTVLQNVSVLQLLVTNAAQSVTVPVELSGTDRSIPPARTIPLRFGAERHGEVKIQVNVSPAGGGGVIATGTGLVQLVPGKEATLRIELAGETSAPRDLGTSPADLSSTDLPAPDLAISTTDLALPDLLAAGDLPQGDLAGCTLAPPVPGGIVLYVAPAGTGGGTTPLDPMGSLTDAIAGAVGVTATILIAEGSYPNTSTGAQTITLKGGYYRSFSCRSPALHPSVITSLDAAEPGLRATGGTVALDGLTIQGKAAADDSHPAIGVDATNATLTVDDCELRSHAATDSTPNKARGLILNDVAATIRKSQVRALGGANSVGAVVVCNQLTSTALRKTTFLDSEIHEANSGDFQGYGLISGGCKGLDLVLDRTRVFTNNTAGYARPIFIASDSDAITVTLDSSAIVALGAYEDVLFTDGQVKPRVIIRSSTISGGRTSGGRGLRFQTGADLDLVDSIVQATTPLDAYPTILSSRRNLFWGMTADQITTTGGSSIVTYRVAYEASIDPAQQSSFDDPSLGPDGYHLQPQSSNALDKGTCNFAQDVDGEPRLTTCDIGADER